MPPLPSNITLFSLKYAKQAKREMPIDIFDVILFRNALLLLVQPQYVFKDLGRSVVGLCCFSPQHTPPFISVCVCIVYSPERADLQV
jgi:hypothetical protein